MGPTESDRVNDCGGAALPFMEFYKNLRRNTSFVNEVLLPTDRRLFVEAEMPASQEF